MLRHFAWIFIDAGLFGGVWTAKVNEDNKDWGNLLKKFLQNLKWLVDLELLEFIEMI